MASRNFGGPSIIGPGGLLETPGAAPNTPPQPPPAATGAPAVDPSAGLMSMIATMNPALGAAWAGETARLAEEARRAEEAANRGGRPVFPPAPPMPGYVPPPPGGFGFPLPPRPGYVPPPPGIAWPRPDVPAGPIERRAPYTQLAEKAIATLRAASREALAEATERARGKQIPAERLMDWIERKTRIGEVLAGPASGWSSDTIADFAQAFQMQAGNLPVMDVLAALALLNWPDLEGELREENTSAPTAGDLLQNRRVIYQHPAPGTPLEPPYVVLVAVEHMDTRRAEEMVGAIVGSLVTASGFRMPREAAAKLG